MRLYSFVNIYLSQLQKGIQTAHIVGEMAAYYSGHKVFNYWAEKEKTIIVLDGGNAAGLFDIYVSLCDLNVCTEYPLTMFREDEESLNNAVTAVGIILPPSIYELAKLLREGAELIENDRMLVLDDVTLTISVDELQLARFINNFRLSSS